MAEGNQKDDLFQVTLPSGRTYGYWKISGLRFPIFDTVINEFDPRPILVKLPEMKGREDDVIVCGCHRSGTNWTWEIVNMLIYQLAEYQKDRKSPTLLEFQSQEYFSNMESPRILSTHLRFNHIPKNMKQKKCKIVYIQRNPKDVTASFYNYWKSEFGVEFLWDDFIHMFLHSDEAMYNSWIGATKSWEQAMKDNPDYPIHLIFYEDIKQIVDLNSNNELEWLANHMGHSLAVHRQYYRLQEQTLELAKVSKLLIATDESQAHKYAGKSLDDMNLEDIDDVVVVDGEVDTDIQDEVEKTGREAAEFEGTGTEATEFERTGKEAEDLDTDELGEESESPHLKQKLEKRKRQRKTWSNEERTLLAKAFHQNFITGSPPGKNFVMSQGKQYRGVKEMIQNRGWKAIKFYVWNLVQQHNKKKKKLTCQK